MNEAEKLGLLHDFIDFVDEQAADEELTINHMGGWTGCAVGQWITDRMGHYTEPRFSFMQELFPPEVFRVIGYMREASRLVPTFAALADFLAPYDLRD